MINKVFEHRDEYNVLPIIAYLIFLRVLYWVIDKFDIHIPIWGAVLLIVGSFFVIRFLVVFIIVLIDTILEKRGSPHRFYRIKEDVSNKLIIFIMILYGISLIVLYFKRLYLLYKDNPILSISLISISAILLILFVIFRKKVGEVLLSYFIKLTDYSTDSLEISFTAFLIAAFSVLGIVSTVSPIITYFKLDYCADLIFAFSLITIPFTIYNLILFPLVNYQKKNANFSKIIFVVILSLFAIVFGGLILFVVRIFITRASTKGMLTGIIILVILVALEYLIIRHIIDYLKEFKR